MKELPLDYNQVDREMSKKTFIRFRNYIQSDIGISIPDAKKIMVESRLLRRLKALEFKSYADYEEYFFSNIGQEREKARFIECITTNKTDFFREIEHFEYMTKNVLPELIQLDGLNEFRLWSGASSTGEEAYTMAMVMKEFLVNYPRVDFKILATDISEEVLNIGQRAIYSESVAAPIPLMYKKKYCLKSKDKENSTVRIKKELRKKVLFKHINLITDSYLITKKYHIIFLRNVMIYFNKDIQSKILNNLYNHLHPEGYLFLGHSENLPNNDIPFKRVGPSIYVKKGNLIHG